MKQPFSPSRSPDPYRKADVLPVIAEFLKHDTAYSHDYGLPYESTPGATEFAGMGGKAKIDWTKQHDQFVVFKNHAIMFYVKNGKVVGVAERHVKDNSMLTPLWGNYDSNKPDD